MPRQDRGTDASEILSIEQDAVLAGRAPVQGTSMVDDWIQKCRRLAKPKKKGMNSTYILVLWMVWKQRNDRVFTRSSPKQPAQLMTDVQEQAAYWCSAGAKHLCSVGWPLQAAMQRTT
uniref:Uncharacterized protein n=1 Tax=Setaria viridis TaxID=4556 RepID=A0A4U6V3K2_SETVI|nr:hypothetical protein SEVIR_5G421500v2 [Setaria viridis]